MTNKLQEQIENKMYRDIVQTPRALNQLAQEIASARAKHPESRYMVEALTEEIGEWAGSDAPLEPGNVEALHIACVAMRIFTEGTTAMPNTVNCLPTALTLAALKDLGKRANKKLRICGS